MLCAVVPAFGASRSGAPAKFALPFGASAGAAYINYPIPTPSQIGVKCGAASFTDGFPPLTMQAASAGGCAPQGQDFNGILNGVTRWNQQSQMGAVPAYDPSFSAAIGGYPEGSILSQASFPSCVWVSQVDNNATNPDSGGSGWTGSCPGGGIGTSTGTNSQIVTTSPFSLGVGSQICFKAGGTNTTSLGIIVNGAASATVYQNTVNGYEPLAGGEVRINTMACVAYDGTNYVILNPATNASLTLQDQTLSGGANVTSYSLGTVSGDQQIRVDCGKGPLEYVVNAGQFYFANPLNDGSCDVKITNTSSAGPVGFAGFTVNSNTGEPITTANGAIFFVHFETIGGVSTYIVKALQ